MSEKTRQPVVVVADDDAITRRIIAARLREAGYVVLPSEDGISALEHFALGLEADALVTDVRMPGLIDGIGLAEEARSQRPRLPVVYMSAHDLGRQRMVPGSHFVRKPYQADYVASALRDAITSASSLPAIEDFDHAA